MFPSHAYLQGHHDGHVPPETRLVVEELERRGVSFDVMPSERFLAGEVSKLTRDQLVVGDFDWTRAALTHLGLSLPVPPDYPACLSHLLHRRVWQCSLSEVRAAVQEDPSANLFVKPAVETKAFSGLIVSATEEGLGWLDFLCSEFPPSLRVWCSELVTMHSEARAYCVRGEVRAVTHYKGPREPVMDADVIREAARVLWESEEGRGLAGCALDFALIRRKTDGALVTGLVEVNDGYSVGSYEGVSSADYADMLIERWRALVGLLVVPPS